MGFLSKVAGVATGGLVGDDPFTALRTGATAAGKAAKSAAEAEAQRQQEWFDYIKETQAPGIAAGQDALSALSGFYGIGKPTYTTEQQKDLDRLSMLNEQMSKFGSAPQGGGIGSQVMFKAQQPQRDALQAEIAALQEKTAGYQPTTPPNQQQFISQVQQSPFYQSMIDQGAQQVGRYAGATGGLRGGNTNLALAQNSQNVLQNLTNQRLSGLSNLAGIGQTAQSQMMSGGAQALGGIGNAYAQGVNAQAQQAAAKQQMMGGLIGAGAGLLGGFI